MKQLLLLVVIHELLAPVRSINGVIWDKTMEDFVPIVSIPTFAALNQEVLNRSRAEEVHDFQGKTVRITYYEVKPRRNICSNCSSFFVLIFVR